jgi:polysaccharide export outer membrane protein
MSVLGIIGAERGIAGQDERLGKPALAPASGTGAATAVVPPADYVIGPDDLLSVVFWREAEMSSQVRVRPDGKISLPLLTDVPAAGLTPQELQVRLEREAKDFITEPKAAVVVLEINSLRVFVVGQVTKPGVFPLKSPTKVLQVLAAAGGVLEYADSKNIVIERSVGSKTVRLPFDYKEVLKGKNLEQNVLLIPGDTVIVP